MNDADAEELALRRWKRQCQAEHAPFAPPTRIEHRTVCAVDNVKPRQIIVFYRGEYAFAVFKRGPLRIEYAERDLDELL